MKILTALLISLLVASCTSVEKTEALVSSTTPLIEHCREQVVSIQNQAKTTQVFDDQRDQLIWAIVVRFTEVNSMEDFASCDDILIALIQSDERLKTALMRGGFNIAGIGIGVLGAASIVDSVADLGRTRGNGGNTTVTGSRAVIGSGTGDGSAASASGDGLGLQNSIASDDSTSIGGQQPRVVTTVANDNAANNIGTQSSSGTDEPVNTSPTEVDNSTPVTPPVITPVTITPIANPNP